MAVDRKRQFVALLAQKALNGEISQELFKKLELAANYSDELKIQELGDSAVLVVVDWLKRGGLEREWSYRKSPCPSCLKESLSFENKDLLLVICPNCMGAKTPLTVPTATQEFQGLSLPAIQILLAASARSAKLGSPTL